MNVPLWSAMFPSSHETWCNKQNTVALLVNFDHMTRTIVTAKLCALSSADFLVDDNMNAVIVCFYTYMYSEITQDLGL